MIQIVEKTPKPLAISTLMPIFAALQFKRAARSPRIAIGVRAFSFSAQAAQLLTLLNKHKASCTPVGSLNGSQTPNLLDCNSGTGTVPFSFLSMLQSNPHLLALLGGTLLGLAIVLATDQIQAYGWAALSAYIGVQCTLPLVRHIAQEEKGGQQ